MDEQQGTWNLDFQHDSVPTLCQIVAQTSVSRTHFIYEISQPWPKQCESCAHYKQIKDGRYCFRNDPSESYRQKTLPAIVRPVEQKI